MFRSSAPFFFPFNGQREVTRSEDAPLPGGAWARTTRPSERSVKVFLGFFSEFWGYIDTKEEERNKETTAQF